jgi:hypothetical protein
VSYTCGGPLSTRETHPSIDLVDLAQQTERLYNCLGRVRVLRCVLLQHVEEDGESS